MTRAAVFLDKDGTLVRDVPYNVDPGRIALAEGAAEGLAVLAEAGFLLVVISNQSGVARGLFPPEALDTVRGKLTELLGSTPLAGFYCCPHHPDGRVAHFAVACDCRKPAPGMLITASDDLDIDLSRSWMVGDILDDVEAGQRAGCRTVLIDPGGETEWRPGQYRTPHYRAGGMADAAHIITSHEAVP